MGNSGSFWLTHVHEIEGFLKTVKRGVVSEICRSAGGKPVYSISYGDRPVISRTANYASAMAANRPEAYFGDTNGRTRSIVVLAAVHGMEIENTVGALNLASAIETGGDLAGNERTAIAEAAQSLRIVIVPLVNPDGRERVGLDDLIGVSDADQPLYCQGRYADGTVMSHPDCKRLHPMPLDVAYLGGYYNDDGVNIQADTEFNALLARETKSLLDLIVSETPEAVANMHSCGLGPFMIHSGLSVPPAYEIRMAQVAGVLACKFAERHLRPCPPYRYKHNDGGFVLDSMFHFLTGSLPILCEGPHGLISNPYTREEILEVQMTFHEVFLTMLAQEGLRPPLPA
jgi:hypothetical protein